MRVTPEYFVKVIDTAVGRNISKIISDDISNYQKIAKISNFLDYEFEIIPAKEITSNDPAKEIKNLFLFWMKIVFLFQFFPT